jgi:NADPH:quinone reductase-like Zn-dependent oxidoreductase
VVIGTQGGQVGQLDFRALGAKQACIYASTLRGRPAPEKAAIVAAVRKHVWPLVECGQVRPVVDRILPLADAGTAHQALEARQHIGKILLAAERSGDT